MNTHDWIIPNWPAPSWVKAVSTTRSGGVSAGVYAALNLAEHVADDPRAVAENRRRLCEQLALPAEPVWLQQVHGRGIVVAETSAPGVAADGAVSLTPGHVCVVMTADCLPVLLCDRAGTRVRAGKWRNRVVERRVARAAARRIQSDPTVCSAIGLNKMVIPSGLIGTMCAHGGNCVNCPM